MFVLLALLFTSPLHADPWDARKSREMTEAWALADTLARVQIYQVCVPGQPDSPERVAAANFLIDRAKAVLSMVSRGGPDVFHMMGGQAHYLLNNFLGATPAERQQFCAETRALIEEINAAASAEKQ